MASPVHLRLTRPRLGCVIASVAPRKRKIAIEIVGNVETVDKSPERVARGFRRLLDNGYQLRADGRAADDPAALLRQGYTPKYEIELFGTRFFLCNQRDADGLKIMPAYVLPAGRRRRVYARVFYKDSSLVWRSASHLIDTPEDEWIGKGAVKWVLENGERSYYSAEETTNLPFELQAALDDVSHRGSHSQNDHRILSLVLRNAPVDRVWPYRDFEAPRERAMSVAANRVNNGRPIATFADASVPESLTFVAGFEPDFDAVIDVSASRSRFYGGDIRKYRIASANRRIQYLFIAGPDHVWIVHPQTFTVELSSYGLRTVDVIADEALFVPGYEFADNDGHGEIDDQIPAGFAGAPCPHDPDRADASPWNERLPAIRDFRARIGPARSP